VPELDELAVAVVVVVEVEVELMVVGALVGTAVGLDACVGVSLGVDRMLEVRSGVSPGDSPGLSSAGSLDSGLSDLVGSGAVVRLNVGVGTLTDPVGRGNAVDPDPPPQPVTNSVPMAAITMTALMRRALICMPRIETAARAGPLAHPNRMTSVGFTVSTPRAFTTIDKTIHLRKLKRSES
jgi:hypothetical protein